VRQHGRGRRRRRGRGVSELRLAAQRRGARRPRATLARAAARAHRFPSSPQALPDGLFAVAAGDAVWLSQPDGSAVIIAGSALGAGLGGDGGSAAGALLSSPSNLAYVAATGALLVADTGNGRVRLLSLASDAISTIVGTTAAAAASGDGGAPAAAALVRPTAVAVSPTTGDVFVGDVGAGCVRRARFGGAALIGVGAGVIDTVVGKCGVAAGAPYPVALATVNASAALGVGGASAIAFDADGTLYVVDQMTLWSVNVAAGTRTALADWSAATPLLYQMNALVVREDAASASAAPAGVRLRKALPRAQTNRPRPSNQPKYSLSPPAPRALCLAGR